MKIIVKISVIVLGVFAVFGSTNLLAKSPKGPSRAPTDVDTKAVMAKFLGHLDALKNYFLFEDKFTDPKNAKEISFHLKAMRELSKKTMHSARLGQENYKLSREVLATHIAETERVFNSGNKPYARWMLGSTLSVCMSCHSQLPSSSRELKSFTSTSNFSDEFSQAEFLFATRAFDKASEIFDRMINSYPSQGVKADQVETALERQVTYYSRIKRNPEEAIKVFSQYEKNEKLPPFVKPSISSWIVQFKNWQAGPQIDPQTATDDQIIRFAKDNLEGGSMPLTIAADNPRLVNYLRVSGVLYEFMQAHPKSAVIPQVLYWLSICDRSVDNNFFFSMSDLYLKECMISYPTDPIAKKCYKEYEDKVVLSYSGSSGTNVPDSVRRELSQLRKYVESGGKTKIDAN